MASKDMDAIQLLTQDHREVEDMFEKYEALGERAMVSKKKLAEQICQALVAHTAIEEEIFYPAVRDAGKEFEDVVDEAVVEHASAKDLIAQLQGMDADEELYDAKVKVLSEQIQHHVQEEEKEMFPKVKKAKLDLRALGQQMQERKQEIEAGGLGDEAGQSMLQAQREGGRPLA
ncbi:MAG: hemerythrin domain-containing protein [Telluria sp.]